MKDKNIRICVECGKERDTGIENRLSVNFNRIDKCMDCLISKCSFKFATTRITLDEIDSLN